MLRLCNIPWRVIAGEPNIELYYAKVQFNLENVKTTGVKTYKKLIKNKVKEENDRRIGENRKRKKK